MAGLLHGVCVGECFFVFPLCGFSLSLFCNYLYVAFVPVRCTWHWRRYVNLSVRHSQQYMRLRPEADTCNTEKVPPQRGFPLSLVCNYT